MNALNGRLLQHTMSGAVAATNAFLRIDLPHCSLSASASCHDPQQPAQSRHGREPAPVAQELSSRYRLFLWRWEVAWHPSGPQLHDPDVAGHQVQDINLSLRIDRCIEAAERAVRAMASLAGPSILPEQFRSSHDAFQRPIC